MMIPPVTLTLPGADATARFAEALAGALTPGDTLLLSGPIGAGKTHFARHMIQRILTEAEDVPSPTYTLVQTYDTLAGPLWHADLYRLSSPDEIAELGLAEAFDSAICLVEWAERLGPLAPRHALWVNLAPDPADDDRRQMTLAWSDPKWALKLEQTLP